MVWQADKQWRERLEAEAQRRQDLRDLLETCREILGGVKKTTTQVVSKIRYWSSGLNRRNSN